MKRWPSWQELSHALGLVIIVLVAIVYAAGWQRDSAVTLALLALASGLVGAPAGWYLIKRNGQQK